MSGTTFTYRLRDTAIQSALIGTPSGRTFSMGAVVGDIVSAVAIPELDAMLSDTSQVVRLINGVADVVLTDDDLQIHRNQHASIGSVPTVIGESGIPVILAPNGTVATNGTVTLGTALPLIYANAWMRLPAGAVVGGLAGLYFVKMTSTTEGQVYTNYADPTAAFVPSIPATQVAAVGSNAGYTQATAADLPLATLSLGAGAMGLNGEVRANALFGLNSTAGAKTAKIKLGASTVGSLAMTTSVAGSLSNQVRNRGAANAQIAQTADVSAGSANANALLAVDTAVAQLVTISGQLAVATDYLVLEGFCAELVYKA